jgi:hypothetical protein
MRDIGHWIFPLEFDPEQFVGFVYRIKDLDTQKEYIGKKVFKFVRRTKRVGKKNREIKIIDSDWKTYCGSCKKLLTEISNRGEERFLFIIESLHECKSTLAWSEIYKLVTEDILRATLPDGTKKYYNGMINGIKYQIKDESEKEKQFKIQT